MKARKEYEAAQKNAADLKHQYELRLMRQEEVRAREQVVAEAKIAEYRKRLDHALTENAQLRNWYYSSKQQQSSLPMPTTRDDRVEQLSDRLRELKMAHQAQSNYIATLHADKHRHGEEQREKDALKAALRKACDALEGYDALRERHAQLQQQLTALSTTNQTLQAELDAAKTPLESATRKANYYEKSVQVFQLHISKLKEENRQLQRLLSNHYPSMQIC